MKKNKNYISAKQEDEKYTHQITEFVEAVHHLRMHKENLHPQLMLRTLQAEASFYRQTLSHYEMCEGSIRGLGPVEPIKFPGFFLEARNYGVEEKINTHNPYASTVHQTSAPQGYGAQPAVVTVTTVQSMPLPPVQASGPRARGLYAFAGSSDAELSFNVGDVMTIISQDGGWWTAELNGRRGFIPSNYVQMI